MPYYMIQGAYNPEGMSALVKGPQNRIAAVKPAIEKLGGTLKEAYFSFGEYDFVIIAEMPDNVSAVAISMAFGDGIWRWWCTKGYKNNAASYSYRNIGCNEESIRS
jgi:uncharacterized protein with GYD domain